MSLRRVKSKHCTVRTFCGRQTVSRILYALAGVAIIRLGFGFPRGSSSLPGNCDGPSLTPQAAPRFPIWPCSMWGLPSRSVSESLVRSYRTFSPLLDSGTEIYVSVPNPAVCFLWHFPSLTGPRITRHTALWSSDFPPSTEVDGDRPSACQPHDFMLLIKFCNSTGRGEWNSKGIPVVGWVNARSEA